MFSGINQGIGLVSAPPAERLSLTSDLFTSAEYVPRVGDSVAVAGACLTFAEIEGARGSFALSSETRRRTTLGALREGARVNLERPLALQDLLHGHLVQGHIDGILPLVEEAMEEVGWRLSFALEEWARPFVVEKGSIALDGVSLTVGKVTNDWFNVFIVPHTCAVTTLCSLRPGDRVNVELDCVAKYLRKFADAYR